MSSSPTEWRILLLDGHESHANYPFLDYAWRHKILVQILPAHSSYHTQPLDIGCFGPLQHYYGLLIGEWFKGGYPAITKADFVPLLHQAREKAYTIWNIVRAWEGAGLVPYNRRKVLDRLEAGKHDEKASTPTKKALNTPKSSREFRQFLKYTEGLVPEGPSKRLILDAFKKLSKSGEQGQAQGAIVGHEVTTLKNRLLIKKNHKTKRAKLLPTHAGKGVLADQALIDQMKRELEKREAEKVEKAAKTTAKKAKEKGKQPTIRKPRTITPASPASVVTLESSGLNHSG